jgi:hypothetical protein
MKEQGFPFTTVSIGGFQAQLTCEAPSLVFTAPFEKLTQVVQDAIRSQSGLPCSGSGEPGEHCIDTSDLSAGCVFRRLVFPIAEYRPRIESISTAAEA